MAYITNKTTNKTGSNITINNAINYKLLNTQLLGDTEQDGTPTPSSPVPIDVVTGLQNITICGKNLHNGTSTGKILDTSGNISTTASTSYLGFNDKIKVKPSTTYTIKFYNIPSGNIKFYYGTWDKDGTFNGRTSANTNNGVATITTPNNGYILFGYLYSSSVSFTERDTNIQVEQGTQASSFEEYKETTYPINLGKNLLNPDYFSVSGNNYKFYSSNPITLEAGKTYTASYKGDNTPYIYFAKPISGYYVTSHSKILSFTPEENVKVFIQFTGADLGTDMSNYQLERGTTATSYSEYFTPIELCKIGNYQDKIRKSTGINLFDKNNYTIKDNTVTWTPTANGGTFSNTGTWGNGVCWRYKLDTTKTYTFKANGFGNNVYCYVRTFTDETFSIKKSDIVNDGTGNILKTFTPDSEYVAILFRNSAVVNNINITNIMLELGDISSEYEPYGKVWYIEKKIGKVVLDGSESWANDGLITNVRRYTTPLANAKLNISSENNKLCNYFSYNYNYNLDEPHFYINNNGTLYLFSSLTDMTQFKNWLSNNNNLVYYPLATPTTTEITNTELINQLEALSKAKSNNGTNNIIVNGIIPSILDLTAYTSENPYQDVIYSQDDRNKAKIWFNDVEMQDFGIKCEKITLTRRIMPNNGKKVLTLSNYVASELEVILHDVNLEDLVDQVKISIGTLTDQQNETYTWIPLGIFNIQNTPVINNNKVTLKLRDNRVKFDFGYNAKPLIDLHGGTATKRQVLEDICTQAGVEHEVDYFEFEDDEIGIYDDSIQTQTYISYLAEQCGCIPATNRDGKLIFVDLSNLFTWRIPLRLIPKPLTIGTPYQIQRVVYEQGVVKYESSNDETLDTLYISSLNPYISSQSQIDYIYNKLKDFKIDTVTTQKLLGNPCIDPYDLIEVYDDSDENEPVVFRTLANQIYTFNGKHWQTFSTEIGKEQRTENVTKITDPTGFRKWASTEIDNINATVNIQTGRMDNIENTETNHYNELINEFSNYAPLTSVDTLTTQVNQIQTDTYTKTQIQEIANGTGVDGVTVTAVVSTEAQFDKDGMHYSKTDAPTNSTIDYKGFEVDDKNGKEIFYAGYDEDDQSPTYGTSIVRTDNINVDTYLQFGNNKGRFEKFEDADGNVGIGLFLM